MLIEVATAVSRRGGYVYCPYCGCGASVPCIPLCPGLIAHRALCLPTCPGLLAHRALGVA